MVNESTPEERLRKYKEQLAKMADDEKRELKSSITAESKKASMQDKTFQKSEKMNRTEPIPELSPPKTLVSPSKRELKESKIISTRSKTHRSELRESTKGSKDKILMKARIKAIDSKFQDIKNRRSTIELQYKRGIIDKGEYEKRMEILVSEGTELLKQKGEIEKILQE